jgi:hypothetical protein
MTNGDWMAGNCHGVHRSRGRRRKTYHLDRHSGPDHDEKQHRDEVVILRHPTPLNTVGTRQQCRLKRSTLLGLIGSGMDNSRGRERGN